MLVAFSDVEMQILSRLIYLNVNKNVFEMGEFASIEKRLNSISTNK